MSYVHILNKEHLYSECLLKGALQLLSNRSK